VVTIRTIHAFHKVSTLSLCTGALEQPGGDVRLPHRTLRSLSSVNTGKAALLVPCAAQRDGLR
jgi:hypothetical protein